MNNCNFSFSLCKSRAEPGGAKWNEIKCVVVDEWIKKLAMNEHTFGCIYHRISCEIRKKHVEHWAWLLWLKCETTWIGDKLIECRRLFAFILFHFDDISVSYCPDFVSLNILLCSLCTLCIRNFTTFLWLLLSLWWRLYHVFGITNSLHLLKRYEYKSNRKQQQQKMHTNTLTNRCCMS